MSFHYGAYHYDTCQIGAGSLWRRSSMAHSTLPQFRCGAVPMWRCSGVAQFRRHVIMPQWWTAAVVNRRSGEPPQFHAVPEWPLAFSLDNTVYIYDVLYRRSIYLIPCWYARVWTQLSTEHDNTRWEQSHKTVLHYHYKLSTVLLLLLAVITYCDSFVISLAVGTSCRCYLFVISIWQRGDVAGLI